MDQHQQEQSSGSIWQASPKVTFYMGLLSGITIISVIGFILTFSMLRSQTDDADTTVKNTNTKAANTNAAAAAAQPTNTAPTKVDIAVKTDDHIRGNKDATVTLVEYSDFECPYCASVRPTLDKILSDYGDKVQLIYRHFPLSFHPQAQKAAEASECASEQGKFWEMHDKLFDMNDAGTLSVENFKKAAGELKLKQSQFDDCLDNDKYANKVKADETEGGQYGVNGTPATFVNGQLVSGALPYDSFKAVIDAAL